MRRVLRQLFALLLYILPRGLPKLARICLKSLSLPLLQTMVKSLVASASADHRGRPEAASGQTDETRTDDAAERSP